MVAALEVTRDLAVGAVERRFSSNALFELVTGSDSEFADSATRGSGFGWDLEREVVVLVGRREADPEQSPTSKRQSRLAEERAIEFWASAVRSHDRSAAAAGLGSELVAVIGAGHDAHQGHDAVAIARAVQAEVAQFARGQYAVGVSRAYPGPGHISTAYQEARTALRLGHRVSGPGAVTAYGELGLFRLLAQVSDDELRAFADETLGPLLALGEPERSEMVCDPRGPGRAQHEHGRDRPAPALPLQHAALPAGQARAPARPVQHQHAGGDPGVRRPADHRHAAQPGAPPHLRRSVRGADALGVEQHDGRPGTQTQGVPRRRDRQDAQCRRGWPHRAAVDAGAARSAIAAAAAASSTATAPASPRWRSGQARYDGVPQFSPAILVSPVETWSAPRPPGWRRGSRRPPARR